MPKFNRKPVEVEAIKFEDTGESVLAIKNMIDNGDRSCSVKVNHEDPDYPLLIINVDGFHVSLDVGGYVVKESNGDLYTWSPELFELAHEEVIE